MINISMVEDALRQIGLTEGEIRVYLALLELGSSSTGNITKRSNISGSKVYEVLERLLTNGFVTEVIKNGVRYFEATSPERILDYLDEKKEDIEHERIAIQKIIPNLILKQKANKNSVVKVFTGWHGLKNANEDIITSLNKGEEWLSMGLTDQPKSWEIHFTKRQKIRVQKGIVLKHLLNTKYKKLFENRKKLPHSEFRFLPKSFETPTSTEIYGDKVIIMILLPADPMAIMIESKIIAENFRRYFYTLWNNAKSA